MRKRIAALLAGIAVIAAAAMLAIDRWQRASEPQWVAVPAPHLPAGPVVLRVVHAVNPRLPRFGDEQIAQLLRTAENTVERSFGVRVAFELANTVEIDDLFRAMPTDVWHEFRKEIVPPGASEAEIAALVRSTHDGLRTEQISADTVRQFALAHLGSKPVAPDLDALARALVAHQLDGLARWRAVLARDGRPVVGSEPHHEWMAWSALGYGQVPYDVVITNQLVASAEHAGSAIHSMLRGGVPIGTTFFGRAARFRTYVAFSTFMFSDELPAVVALRDDGPYTGAEAATLAGAYLAHELGHQLLYLGHPYANDACVMRPVPMFQFRTWHERLDPARCPLGSDPQMTNGVVSLAYDRRFVD